MLVDVCASGMVPSQSSYQHEPPLLRRVRASPCSPALPTGRAHPCRAGFAPARRHSKFRKAIAFFTSSPTNIAWSHSGHHGVEEADDLRRLGHAAHKRHVARRNRRSWVGPWSRRAACNRAVSMSSSVGRVLAPHGIRVSGSPDRRAALDNGAPELPRSWRELTRTE